MPARSVRLTPRLRLRPIPLSSIPDTTVIPMPTDTVLADTMADMVDTPAVDTTVMEVMEVMPTTVKQTNKQAKRTFKNQIMKKRNIAIVKKSTKKLPSDIVLKISSRNQKKITVQ